ncbi:hypothetical protein GCM10012280_63410 [Wenjunlia tyrosinilytica]|uniref:Uncharacterized protein n=1 Tax=Wenjunlia tyrosinilytica TaxID=1544741 RepID=A0A917ZX05_9ACTN|nr:hypothetical protein GCM10012280_63410 [Wenjunlia tyrosinilytica]
MQHTCRIASQSDEHRAPKKAKAGSASPKITLEEPEQIARDLARHLTQEQVAEVAQLLLEHVSTR